MSSILGKFFGSLMGGQSSSDGGEALGEAVDYKGFSIRPAPRREGSQWLTAGIISKQVGDEVKEHRFVRADLFASKEEADACALRKARQIIDEQGDGLLG